MSTVNGAAPPAGEPVLREGAAEVIQLLREILKDAEQGKIVGLGVVAVTGPLAIQVAGTKNYLLEMLSGTEDLHDYYKAIKAQLMMAAQQQQHPRSNIVRPPAGLDPSKLRG